jgi:hypothetical protein
MIDYLLSIFFEISSLAIFCNTLTYFDCHPNFGVTIHSSLLGLSLLIIFAVSFRFLASRHFYFVFRDYLAFTGSVDASAVFF